jgi:hypothetical protein
MRFLESGKKIIGVLFVLAIAQVGLLTQFGSNALLGLALLCSCGALLILLWLSRRRPTIGATAAI